MKPEITVYVRSKKIKTGETLVEELYSIKRPSVHRDAMFKAKIKKIYSYVLPDDQKTLVDVVKRLSERKGFELKVVDVAKENSLLHKLWRKLRGMKNFPLVETNRGERLQAPFSQSELERFVSESVQPTN